MFAIVASASTLTYGASLDSTADTPAEAVDVFTLSITDNVNNDGLPLDISEVRIGVSGTSTENTRSNISWRLNGPDLIDVGGTYDPVSQQVSFSSISISVAEGNTEEYRLSVFYLDNSALVDQSSFILTLDPLIDYTVELSGSPIGSAASVSNTFTTEIVAVGLSISSDLSGVSVASGQPIEAGFTISAHDEFGNVDRDYAETLTFSTTSPGSLRNNSIDAVNGVATFDELEYVASADNEPFELTVDDVSGVSFDFPAMAFTGLQSDIIATQIAFVQNPEPTSAPLGTPLLFTTQPIVHLVDRDRQLDTDFNGNISFIRSGNGTTSGTSIEFSASGDLNDSLAVVELPVVNGVLEFTDLTVNFCSAEFVNGDCTQMDNTIIGAFAGGSNTLGITFRRSPLIDLFGFHEDGQVVEASTILEPVSIPTTANTVESAAAVFDFTIQDLGSDLRSLEISQLEIDTSGSTLDPARLEFLLSGPDVNNVVGVLSDGLVSFSDVGISIADGSSEVYTVSVYLKSSIGLVESQQLSLAINGASNLTIVSPSSIADSASSTLSSGGSFIDVQASELVFSIQPSDAESGQVISVTPQITAIDAFGNVDGDFNESVTLATSAPGVLTNNISTAVNGVASFPSLTYVASTDKESVVLVANDEDAVGANLPQVNATSFLANITATQVIFTQMPSPLTVQSGVSMLLDTAPVIAAVNDAGVVDIDFTQAISLLESSASQTPGTLNFSINGVSSSVASVNAVAGIADFTGLSLTYTNGDPTQEEAFALSAVDEANAFNAITSNQFQSLGVNRDGVIEGANTVVEGSAISTTAVDFQSSVPVLDFVIRDGGGGDLLPLNVTDISFDLTGSTIPLGQLDYFLIGPDLNEAAQGVVSAQRLVFSNLPISVTEGLEQTYQVNVSFNDATGLSETQLLQLSIDANADVTLSSSSSLLSSSLTSVDNGINGNVVDVVATQLTLNSLVSSVVSGATIPDFDVVATDSVGNTDRDFNDALTVTISAAGTLSGTTTVNAVSGIASFSGLSYIATQDIENFTLNADEADSNGTLTETSAILSSDVLATQLVFEQNISASTINVGIDVGDNLQPYLGLDNVLVGVPVVSARDDNGLVDIDFSGVITLVNGIDVISSQTRLSATFDEDFDDTQVSQSALSGVATFSELTLNYTPENVSDTLRIDALSPGLTSALGVVLTDLNFQPILFESANNFGPFNVSEDVQTPLDFSDLRVRDDDDEQVSLTLSVSSGVLVAIDGEGVVDGVTLSGTNGSQGSQTLVFAGRPTELNNFFTTARVEFLNQSNNNGNVTLTVSITDGVLDGNQLSELIVVAGVNDAPQISGVPSSSVQQDQFYSFVPTASDIDPNSELTFSVINQPSWLTFDSLTGALTGTPSNAEVGIYENIVLSVSDSILTSSLPAFSITVENVNDVPMISGSPALSVQEDSTYQFIPSVVDPDANELLTFSVQNLPSWASFNASTGEILGIPTVDNLGVFSNIMITVSDSEANATLAPFDISVIEVNDVPQISGVPDSRAIIDSNYTFVPTAFDEESPELLVFSVQNLPEWLSFDSQTGALSGIPQEENVGTFSAIVISVSDGELSSSLSPFSIVVDSSNDSPQISGVPPSRALVGQSYSFTPSGFDPDEGDTLNFTVTNLPSWLSFDAQTGALAGVPQSENIGVFRDIVITVSDGNATDALPAFNIEVVAGNLQPVLSGNPPTSVDEDSEYRFTPSSSDPDGDDLLFSISNRPVWLEFNRRTGELLGTPTNEDIGRYSNIIISVSDGELSASLSSFAITVNAINDAPTSEDINVSVDQDSTVQITPLIQDEETDSLTVEVVSPPINGNVVIDNGLFTYRPDNNFVGTDEFTYRSNDGELSSAVARVTIDVIQVDNGPIAVSDVFNVQQNSTGTYLFDVLANDINAQASDVILEGVSTQFGVVEVEDNIVILTVNPNFVGQVNLTYSVVDSNNRRDSAQVVVTIEADNLPETISITVPDDIVVNATGLLTQVELGSATALDIETNQSVPVSLVDETTLFEPGTHNVVWSATNSEGVETFASQQVQVVPLVSLSVDHEVVEGQTTRVHVFLNGESPNYPVVIPVLFSGSAVLGEDYTVPSEQIIIEEGNSGFIDIVTLADDFNESEQTLIVELGEEVNAGVNRTSFIRIVEQALAPQIALSVVQASQSRLIVNQEEGNVLVEAVLSDIDLNAAVFEWIAPPGFDDLNPAQGVLEFDPTGVSPGAYQISALVTDSRFTNLSRRANVIIELRELVTPLGNEDSDNDLVSDVQEGISDSDQDGIPDYLDRIDQCNVLPAQVDNQTSFLIEGEPGICIRRGLIATVSETGGAQISDTEVSLNLVEDLDGTNVGGVFDFVVNGLPVSGSSYRIVLPQQLPIPADAQYRKLLSGEWISFVENEQNQVYSAPGSSGVCPPPGDSDYRIGLTEGHWCVQLQIEDGGPNDDDGIANGSISDPGGVATVSSGNQRPIAVNDSVQVLQNIETPILVLNNDVDADNDNLRIVAASANLGRVLVSSDGQQLRYVPDEGFIGDDLIRYGISDGNGGTAAAQVSVVVVQNIAPVAMDDAATTNHRTPIEINVLENDIDTAGDNLTIESAVALAGQVTITDTQTLIYTPALLFDGEDTIMYTVSDGIDVSLAVVTVSVQGNRNPIANDDNTTLLTGSSVRVNVLANDTDEDNDILTVVEVSLENGEAIINQDSTITFIPDSDFVGDKQIRYVVEDEFGATDEAIVTVTVIADESEPSRSSSGGSVSLFWLWLLVVSVGHRAITRRRQAA